uniref:Uncharacterized protein n=1 Tax=Trichuris muris TaxID=70415 RepID=A0A5S6QLF1_TRIMR
MRIASPKGERLSRLRESFETPMADAGKRSVGARVAHILLSFVNYSICHGRLSALHANWQLGSILEERGARTDCVGAPVARGDSPGVPLGERRQMGPRGAPAGRTEFKSAKVNLE